MLKTLQKDDETNIESEPESEPEPEPQLENGRATIEPETIAKPKSGDENVADDIEEDEKARREWEA